MALIAVLMVSGPSAGESGAIAPDRPGLSTGTHTVSPGFAYVEMGYQYAFTRTGVDTATLTLPQFVLRTGITDALELDLIWDGWNRDHLQGSDSEISAADVTVGGKYRLYQSDRFNLTLMGLLSLPVGTEPSTSDEIEPLLGLLWDCRLTSQVQLFGAFQSKQLEQGDESAIENQLALGVTYSHSDRLASFVEYFATQANELSLEQQRIIDAGLTFLYSDDMQLDISVGAGLNDATNHFISVGMAYRF